MDATSIAPECLRLDSSMTAQLVAFFDALERSGDGYFFSPHPLDEATLARICSPDTKDLYYVLAEGKDVIGYGLLRGWDEGYQIPSLGIAIHPRFRGYGFGLAMMHFLHAVALRRGADSVRLRVRRDNPVAIALYTRLGYVFSEPGPVDEFLVGLKALR